MEAHREDEYINPTFTDGINQSMFVGDASAPFAIRAFQRFWLANTGEWMRLNVFQQFSDAFNDLLITRFNPVFLVSPSLLQKNYFHKSSRAIGVKFPSSISLSPSCKISTMAGEDMMYSVSSIVRFLATILLSAFTAFFIRLSSSDMTCKAAKSSEFNCKAVIMYFFAIALQSYGLM